MKTINGHKYSRGIFKDYKFRAIFALEVKDEQYLTKIHIYTTNSDREEVLNVIKSRAKEQVISVSLFHWTTKEQDDRDTLFIEETLKGI